MKLEIFYDYSCPYCYEGLNQLKGLIKNHPELELDFMPCEAHPRPEPAKIHSDMAAQLAFFLKDKRIDLREYNDLVYKAHFEEKARIDDVKLLGALASECGVSAEEATAVLKENKYADKLSACNELVWSKLKADAVPGYRYGEKTAFSTGGSLVDLSDVERLIR